MQLSPLVPALLAAGIAPLVLAALALRRHHVRGTTTFAALMVSIAVWDLLSAVGAALVSLEGKVLAAQVQYLGIASAPALWLLFAIRYTRTPPVLPRRVVGLLWVVPALTVGMAFTNPAHGLLWREITLVQGTFGVRAVFSYGPWFWLAAAVNYVYLFVGTAMLVRGAARVPRAYAGQTAALLVGVLVPWVGNAAYLAGLVPIPGFDPTPVGFTLGGVGLFLGVFRLRLFDLAPMARHVLVERLVDGVLVFDARGRLADVNPAAVRLLDLPSNAAIGAPASTLLHAWPELLRATEASGETALEVHRPGTLPCSLDVRAADVYDRASQRSGRLVLVRDVTQAVLQRRRREALLRAARRLAQETDPLVLLRQLIAEAGEVVGADFGAVVRWDADRTLLTLVAHTVPGWDTAAEMEFGTDQGLIGRAARLRAPQLENDYVHSADALEVVRSAGARAVVAVPLFHEQNLLGVVVMASVSRMHRFEQRDIEDLEVLASIAGGVLVGQERARLAGVLLASRTAQHELNNRLALTSGYSELLARDGTLSPRLRGFAEESLRGVREAADILDRLQRAHRIEEHDWGTGVGATIDLDRSA